MLSPFEDKPSAPLSPAEAVAELETLFTEEINRVSEQFTRFAKGERGSPSDRPGVYPEVRIELSAADVPSTSSLTLGQPADQHVFATTITRPALFRDYLLDQLAYVQNRYNGEIRVGLSDKPIPLTFAQEAATGILPPGRRHELQAHFHLPNLVATNDDIVDGRLILDRSGAQPLSLFTAERTDYSLYRLRHYTATDPADFQPFVLLTNYQRYVDEFTQYAKAEIEAGRATRFVEPGDRVWTKGDAPEAPPLAKLPQMPAYHLARENGPGVTLVNIGVGPSNAKTMTDHLAVLRPHCWLMIGHCGALRRTQRLGDYILAHAYLRHDNVLDFALPPHIPLPTIAEVQVALADAVAAETGLSGKTLKQALRTGTVVTTDDRNWELRFSDYAIELNQSRAIAIDMESATIAANGYRYRVPYGTLLCASDKPLHGEIKLPGMADAFYQERVGQHLMIGLRAIEQLGEAARAGTLHSRKLRSFDEPLFR